MEKDNIMNQITQIFRTELGNNALVLTNNLTAADVDNWDSLSHMLLITEIEEAFGIKFKLKELNKMNNVGDLINFIAAKV